MIDPEGDYSELEGAVVLGDAKQQPRIPELLDILRRPDSNAVVNMLDVDLADRPAFFDGLMTRLSELRAQTGRPHWIVVDEAHHLVPAARPAAPTLPRELQATILVTVHPGPAGAGGPGDCRDGRCGRRCTRAHDLSVLHRPRTTGTSPAQG